MSTGDLPNAHGSLSHGSPTMFPFLSFGMVRAMNGLRSLVGDPWHERRRSLCSGRSARDRDTAPTREMRVMGRGNLSPALLMMSR